MGGGAIWGERVGVTLSERPYSSARDAVASSELADLIEIQKQHYMDIQDFSGFDKIVSAGRYEHVGLRNLATYFQAVARLLRPGGVSQSRHRLDRRGWPVLRPCRRRLH